MYFIYNYAKDKDKVNIYSNFFIKKLLNVSFIFIITSCVNEFPGRWNLMRFKVIIVAEFFKELKLQLE